MPHWMDHKTAGERDHVVLNKSRQSPGQTWKQALYTYKLHNGVVFPPKQGRGPKEDVQNGVCVPHPLHSPPPMRWMQPLGAELRTSDIEQKIGAVNLATDCWTSKKPDKITGIACAVLLCIIDDP
uniref:Uncharacterized protein n=1 Tax=Eutreptiella gymnastica TaxID=73025 RepID=A0A7S4LHD5_9EUGL